MIAPAPPNTIAVRRDGGCEAIVAVEPAEEKVEHERFNPKDRAARSEHPEARTKLNLRSLAHLPGSVVHDFPPRTDQARNADGRKKHVACEQARRAGSDHRIEEDVDGALMLRRAVGRVHMRRRGTGNESEESEGCRKHDRPAERQQYDGSTQHEIHQSNHLRRGVPGAGA